MEWKRQIYIFKRIIISFRRLEEGRRRLDQGILSYILHPTYILNSNLEAICAKLVKSINSSKFLSDIALSYCWQFDCWRAVKLSSSAWRDKNWVKIRRNIIVLLCFCLFKINANRNLP